MPSYSTAIASLVTVVALAMKYALTLFILGDLEMHVLSEIGQQYCCKCIESWLHCTQVKCNSSHQVPLAEDFLEGSRAKHLCSCCAQADVGDIRARAQNNRVC